MYIGFCFANVAKVDANYAMYIMLGITTEARSLKTSLQDLGLFVVGTVLRALKVFSSCFKIILRHSDSLLKTKLWIIWIF